MTAENVFQIVAVVWAVSPVILIPWVTKLRGQTKEIPNLKKNLAEQHQYGQSVHSQLTAALKKASAAEKNLETVGSRLLKDNVKFIGSKVTANNYSTSKKSLEGVFGFCEKQGCPIPGSTQKEILADLKKSFEEAVKKDWQREEQARIKRQIREEQKLEAERLRELQRLENQELSVQTALQKALQKAQSEHDEEVERLRAQLAEAQDKLQRAKSMAEMTRAGFVYVISNIGSFGRDFYKVGMTRRLEPLDRVKELGDASVPFPYDVHMMISCDDAPALENALHKALHAYRVNRVNPRREFFKADLQTIAQIVEQNHGRVDYVMEPEAIEYNESQNMSEEDYDFVASQTAMFDEDEEGFKASAAPKKQRVAPTKPVQPASAKTEQPPEKPAPVVNRERVACPICDGDIFADTLVEGSNTCPSCQGEFKVSLE